MKRIAVLVSGGGTNLQALIHAERSGVLKSGKIELVVSSNSDAYALKRAMDANIKTATVNRSEFANTAQFDEELCDLLVRQKVDLVVLAGFLCILGPKVLSSFSDRIVNVHPSLIPAFSGPGYYGLKVHEQALKRGVKISGATVHLVNEIVDGGRIISQKAVDVQPDDTPQTLQKRIMEQAEWIILPRAVEQLCSGK